MATSSASNTGESENKVRDTLIWLIEQRGFDVAKIYDLAKGWSVAEARNINCGLSAIAGAGSVFVPIAGIAWDVVGLLEGMAKASFSVGSAIASRNGLDARALDAQDYVDVLLLWAGMPEAMLDVAAKQAIIFGNLNVAVGSMAAKAIPKVGVFAHATISATAAKKIAAKLVAKLAGKLVSHGFGWIIPFLPSALNGSVNAWITWSIADVAEVYYNAKFGIALPPSGFLKTIKN
ncbi:MAG: hypothetical protein EAZ74_03260 [Alphaproteobacteria bacterium]|nr:MAG: hypothetical protein EAY76_00565 [Alphaproteobacteria bacterium]TAF14765.1 MAG: hypothetical protein EAZ74_03260 [Alphaproteobacteria bacterium]TAF76079.1 MAG: hypothetical protein EAZ52_05135 [Alphaproteobacteria bacterium]